MRAITRQSLSCIRILLDKIHELKFDNFGKNKLDALVSRDKKNILHVAAQIVGDKEIIDSLDHYSAMDELADRKDCKDRTPLIIACRHQNHLMARMLVKKNAKIDSIDKDKCSPIYWAASTGSSETLKFLLHDGEC